MSTISLGSSSDTSSGSILGQLDVQYIVEQIIYAKQEPIRDLEEYQTLYEAKKTAFQELNTKLSAVERSLYTLTRTGFEAKTVTSGDSSVLTASAGSSAQSGTYDLVVKQLARAQSSATTTFSSASESVLTNGSTLTITQGDETVDIDIAGDTESLNGLRNAINTSGLDVTASVINQGGAYYLQITSDSTGTDNGFTVTDTGVGSSILTRQSAMDAQFYLNTDPNANPTDYITRQSNSINDVIEGVTLQLNKVDSNPVTLNVANDTSGITEYIDNFIEQFNAAITFLNEQFTYNESEGMAGVLSGESTARKAQSDLLGIVSTRVAGLEESDRYKTLSTIGIDMANDGTLSVDSSKLETVLENDLDNVIRLFKNQGTSSHSEISYAGKSSDTVAGTYAVNITQVAEQAQVTADTAVDTTLGSSEADNETLTFALSGKSVNVSLTYDMTIGQIVSAVNTAFENAGFKAYATQNSNILSVLSDEYGSSQILSASSTGTRIFSGDKNDTGVDVAGTIGGNAATGNGQLLTGSSGDSKGLMVFVESQTVGDKGQVTLTYGVGEQLRLRMYDLTFPYTGLLAKNVEALDTQLENIDEKIAEINSRLAEEEELLITQYTKANEALAQLQYLQSTLSNSFST